MDADRFKQLVSRLEAESASAPGAYRLKVAALTLLGFAILALLFTSMGLGLLVLVGLLVAIVYSGGGLLLLLLKLGKLLLFLAIPMWFLGKSGLKALFMRLPAPQGREITRADAPVLFGALDRMRSQMRGPQFHHVLVIDEVNAAVLQRPAFGLVGWPRNYLLLGLPMLEGLSPDEALAVVAHEYGHLAGSHGHFSAFIYRLRHTWGTVQSYTDQFQGWLGRLVAPLIRWYAPYFNAYTFVLARADEYQADAASARLVGAAQAAHALKRMNVVVPRHQRFMDQTYDRIALQAKPPADLLLRWAGEATAPLPAADAERWLGEALDREGHYTDSHPTLRARLVALAASGEQALEPPPALAGPSAAQAWLGPLADTLRAELQALWAEQLAEPWAERHEQAQQQRRRLATLHAQPSLDADETLERLQLQLSLEPEADLRAPLAAFNAEHADSVLGLFLEGRVRLDHGEREGLALLDRVCALDPEAIKPACQAAWHFLLQQGEPAAAEAEAYAERWRARDALETLRSQQLQHFNAKDQFTVHGWSDEQLAKARGLLTGPARKHVAEVHLARRVIPADPSAVQWILGVRLNWWGRRIGKQSEVVNRLAQLEWPMPLTIVSLDGSHASWLKKLRRVVDARML